jgi:hypothetical protein
MIFSESQSYASEADRENVIEAFKDWRPKKLMISTGIVLRNIDTRPSVMRRVFRTIAFGVIAIFIALAVVVWQSGSHEAVKAVSALRTWLTRFTTDASAIPIGVTKAPPDNTAASSQGAPPASAVLPTEEEYNAIRRDMDALTNELTEVRRIAEQLAANQAKMSDDIAALKANEESINQTLLSTLPHQPTVSASAAPRKKPRAPTRLGVTGRSSNEHPSVGAPLPLR